MAKEEKLDGHTMWFNAGTTIEEKRSHLLGHGALRTRVNSIHFASQLIFAHGEAHARRKQEQEQEEA